MSACSEASLCRRQRRTHQSLTVGVVVHLLHVLQLTTPAFDIYRLLPSHAAVPLALEGTKWKARATGVGAAPHLGLGTDVAAVSDTANAVVPGDDLESDQQSQDEALVSARAKNGDS